MSSGMVFLSPVHSRRKGERKRGRILKRTREGSVPQSLCLKYGVRQLKELGHSDITFEGAKAKSFIGGPWSRSTTTTSIYGKIFLLKTPELRSYLKELLVS
jgi:hypothetical protein